MTLPQQVTDAFEEQFGAKPTYVVRAPGRVNLIGEHTDYNDGFVLPMAIDRAAWVALRPRADRRLIVRSLDVAGRLEASLDDLQRRAPEGSAREQNWGEYVRGVAWALQEAGHALHGWEGVLAGDVPMGAGLSSSAALEMAVARAFAAVSGIPWDAAQMARLGQRAENGWVGVNSGIMDQMISASGQAGHALLIDCRSLETQNVPLPPATRVIILDTRTRRSLVGSAYNERRAQCQAAARYFGVPALRDVTLPTFAARAGEMEEPTRRRARHVISENARTLAAAEAMRARDAATLGQLMNESHSSLRDDFEVSSDALDAMVAAAQAEEGCYGARMTGAGFGGCAVALVVASRAERFAERVAERYEAQVGLTPSLYLCDAAQGAEVVEGQAQ